MNEELVKKIIQYKLQAASKIVNRLPADMSNEMKDLGRIILDSLNEGFQEIKKLPENKMKSKNVISNIRIE
jgi:hypothetical protein